MLTPYTDEVGKFISTFLLHDNVYTNVDLKSGTIDLCGRTVHIYGDFIQEGGTININGGRLIVDGNYRIQSLTKYSDGTVTYSCSSSILKMTNTSDYVSVGESFVMDSTGDNSGYLITGTLKVAGDFTQMSTNNGFSGQSCSNFNARGTNKVILSGTGTQTVSFKDPYDSGFNQLDILNGQNRAIAFANPVKG